MKQVQLTRGHIALVDDEDYAAVVSYGSWQSRVHGDLVYAAKTIWDPATQKWQTILLHTFITGWPFVDHKNRNGLDNRRMNLREATREQNMANRKTNLNNQSGFKGVHRAKHAWVAQCARRYLGSFPTAEEAARAYDAAAIERWGEYARPNFPQGVSA